MFLYRYFGFNAKAIPNSLTILMRDGRGIGRFFIALFAALGSLIIPKREKEAVKKNLEIKRIFKNPD